MTESQFQAKLIKRLGDLFPGCVVMKNDANLQQGIPDLTILYRERWAMLEVKASPRAAQQPNQQHFVSHFDEMSFAAIIHPENEEEVLGALQRAFEPDGSPCVSQS